MDAWRTLPLLLLAVMRASAIVELTDSNFFDYAKDKDVLLVDFYAPWCSDCQKLAPDFENAGAILGARTADLAKVDCFGAGKGLCQMYGVKSWPQLKNFNRGTYTGDYTGPQTGEAMAAYVNTVANAAQPNLLALPNPYAMNVAPYPVYAAPARPGFNIHPAFAPKLPAAAARPMPPLLVKSEACAKCDTPRYPMPSFRLPAPFMMPCIRGRSCITKKSRSGKGEKASSLSENQGSEIQEKKSSTSENTAAKAKNESSDATITDDSHKGFVGITLTNTKKKTAVVPVQPRDMPDDKRTLTSVVLGKNNAKK